jgi:general secretion pathway protein H
MPMSVAGSNDRGFTLPVRSAEHGFTLVELMIVIAILAVASAAVVMVLPDPRGRLRDEATRFAARTRAAHDLAITEARPVELWVSNTGYGFAERADGQWRPLGDKPFRVVQWPGGMHAQVPGRAELVFDPTGIADRALDVTILREGDAARVSIAGDGSVRVTG